MLNNSITAICVVYQTKDLVQKAIESFRSFYFNVPMVVVDNSTEDGECSQYLQELSRQDENMTVYTMPENIGHGPGMDYALRKIETDWAYIFDSDTEMFNPGLFELFFRSDNGKKLAVGDIHMVSHSGINKGMTKTETKIPYIHPAACFINRKLYLTFPPFRYHGAPCIDTYAGLYKQGLSDELLLNLPMNVFVKHKWRGTRSFYKMKPWKN